MGWEEWTVVVLVVGGRLLLPLIIPYRPLIGILACLILDSADQSIFQWFPAIPLEGYQSYDKALDIYYLSIAYMSTMRNWANACAFRMGRFLFYYRLVGDLLFELSGVRALLFIFPNTFEYFFIFYEAVRMRWDVRRMGKWTVIIATALIWIFIKLPQEWWIHIAQLDVTDFMRETLFGVSTDATWGEAIGNAPWVLVAMIAGMALLVFVAWWIITRKAPAGDHGIVLKADPLPAECRGAELYRTVRAHERIFDRALAEKAVMVALIGVIFAQILLAEDVNNVAVAAFVVVFIAVNAFVSQLMARRGRTWRSVAVELGGMALVNLVIVLSLEFAERVLRLIDTRAPLGKTLFFVFLLTVLTVLFDRYHTVFEARGMLRRGDQTATPAADPA